MINKKSPKLKLNENFFNDEFLINRLLIIIEKFLKIHIKNQVDNGADVIQIFDSWAGLLNEKDLPNYVYIPTLSLIEYTKSLNVPVICFPRGIKNYKNFCDIVKPDAVCIDYEVDPFKNSKRNKNTNPRRHGPQSFIVGKRKYKKEAIKYLDIFKDHPYIFNLGHGVLPETNPNMMDYLVKTIKRLLNEKSNCSI